MTSKMLTKETIVKQLKAWIKVLACKSICGLTHQGMGGLLEVLRLGFCCREKEGTKEEGWCCESVREGKERGRVGENDGEVECLSKNTYYFNQPNKK